MEDTGMQIIIKKEGFTHSALATVRPDALAIAFAVPDFE